MTITDPLAGLKADRFLDRRYHWLVFRAFNAYRLILAALLLVALALDDQGRLFGRQNPTLFLDAALVYMLLVLAAMGSSFLRRPGLLLQAHVQMLVDLMALTVMIHASGGPSSSLNSLLITAVAASSILLPLTSALLAAALGFLLLTVSWLIGQWQSLRGTTRALWREQGLLDWLSSLGSASDELVRLGILGAVLFLVAGLTYALAERARRGEALARQRTAELLDIAELNQGIIRHLQSGVVVTDTEGRLLLINAAAQNLLDVAVVAPGLMLAELSPPLWQRLRDWQSGAASEAPAFRPADHRPELIARFTQLGEARHGSENVLVLLEDSELAAERLQQLKLAALGRLTAGIAHEIRNPLAAIGHAAQLLQESTSANPTDRRLGQIIHNNVQRANRIIGDVLDLARRDRLRSETFTLLPWLESFSQECANALEAQPRPLLSLWVEPPTLQVSFDPHQLRQVLWNLYSNACRHGSLPGAIPRISLSARLDAGRGRPVLEVQDAGPGVPAEHIDRLFEPFFTTRSDGTGLGLYLARELCEANRAQLQYVPGAEGGSCFRIVFAS